MGVYEHLLSLISHWQDGLEVSTDMCKKILVDTTEWMVPNSAMIRIYLKLKTRPLTVARFVAGMREKWESFHSSPAWAECRELLNSLLETFLLSPFSRLLSHFIENSQRYRWIDTIDTIDSIVSIYNRYIQNRIDIPIDEPLILSFISKREFKENVRQSMSCP